MGTLQAGDIVGRYRVEAAIGEGEFGTVYRAWDPDRRRAVAIKELSSDQGPHDPALDAERQERFRMERRIQTQLVHPHVVAAFEPIKIGETEYLIEEYLDGGTLAELLEQEGPLSPEYVVQIGIEMCQAIAAASQRDIVHRDIRPSNILLARDAQAKLTGFGSAQVGDTARRRQTDNAQSGPSAYASPEQQEGYEPLDERSDLYSLGLVLYEALTGSPFGPKRVPVRRLAPKVPADLEWAIMRALEYEPDARYENAAALETALHQALDKRQPRWVWAAAGIGILAALIVAGGVIIRLTTGNQPSSPEPTSTPTGRPTETLSASPTHTPVVTEATPEPTAAPSVTPSPLPTASATPTTRPTATEAPAPTATTTPSPAPTRLAVVVAPIANYPPGGASVRTPDLTLTWTSALPSRDYGFVVTMYQKDGLLTRSSPVLPNAEWTVHLPGAGPARDAVGEWRWTVLVVRRAEPYVVLGRSAEATFYFNPFAGP